MIPTCIIYCTSLCRFVKSQVSKSSPLCVPSKTPLVWDKGHSASSWLRARAGNVMPQGRSLWLKVVEWKVLEWTRMIAQVRFHLVGTTIVMAYMLMIFFVFLEKGGYPSFRALVNKRRTCNRRTCNRSLFGLASSRIPVQGQPFSGQPIWMDLSQFQFTLLPIPSGKPRANSNNILNQRQLHVMWLWCLRALTQQGAFREDLPPGVLDVVSFDPYSADCLHGSLANDTFVKRYKGTRV